LRRNLVQPGFIRCEDTFCLTRKLIACRFWG
jgi:hypothetical protein